MAKELTFSEATLGWRFAHTDIFLKHFIKQWELLQDVQIKNLEDYWNINDATGKWLNQIGELFDTARVQTVSPDAFMLNVSRLNDPEEAHLNGIIEEVEDDLFRKLILVRSLSVNKLFSMKNIAETLYEVFGRDQIKVQFRENITNQGVPKDRYFQLLLTFKDTDMIRAFNGMQLLRPNLFLGKKPMGVSYNIYLRYNPNFNSNAILCGVSGSAYPMWNSYQGTDASITDTSVCYSYDGTHFTMYIDNDRTVPANVWTPVYQDKELTTVAAYIRRSMQIPPLPSWSSKALAAGNCEVYFPLLGETEVNARNCFIGRARIQE